MAFQHAHALAAGDVPQPDRVVATGGGGNLSVWADRQAGDRPRVPFQAMTLLLCCDVPDAHRHVVAGGNKRLAIWSKTDGVYVILVADEAADIFQLGP